MKIQKVLNIFSQALAGFALVFPYVSQAVEMPPEYYEVQEIPLPVEVAPEIGGLKFNSKGELIVLTRRSGILIAKPHQDPNQFQWRTFTAVSYTHLTLPTSDLV